MIEQLSTLDFLSHLRKLDIHLSIQDDRLACSAPKGILNAELTAEMWEPVLRRATQRGEIRSDLDVMAVGQWLAVVQFILVGRRDVTGTDDPSTRVLLKTFVLPAFIPAARAA